jgi:TonB family protein
MSRGLPYSIIIHVLMLALVMVYGNAVSRQEIKSPRSIRVRMVQLPQAAPRPETRVETPPEEVKPPVKQEKVPELPPKEVPRPKPKPEKKPPVEKKPEPRPEPKTVEPPETSEPPADEAGLQETPAVGGPSVEGTDVDFPFAWYLARVQGQIARNWNPRQLGFRSRRVVSCVVHFTINRNGTVSRITLTQPSGVGVFDREALRVVQSSRIPPLPPGFGSSTLGVSMKFNLESGI